jgi:site-specific recombinase XerD
MLHQKLNSDPDYYVFTNNGRKIEGNSITHKFKDILTLSGIKKKGLHIHSLRHTFASWLVQDGVPLYEVQKLLGHSTITVTEIYAHLQPFQLHSAVNKIHIRD